MSWKKKNTTVHLIIAFYIRDNRKFQKKINNYDDVVTCKNNKTALFFLIKII